MTPRLRARRAAGRSVVSTTMLYLYGFAPAASALPPNGLAGTAAAPVELIPREACAAVVSRVASTDFTPEALATRTSDLAWVGERGIEHERVVAWFVDHAEILPVPLFTLYSSEVALRADAADRAAYIAATLEAYAGLREWDLKVAYRETELRNHAAQLSLDIAELERQIAGAAPGRRFLLERQRDELLTREVRRAARRMADELLASACPSCARTRRLPVVAGADEGAVVLNAALLVPAGEEPALRARLAARAAELSPLGFLVSFSGPWAPYRFLAPEPSLA